MAVSQVAPPPTPAPAAPTAHAPDAAPAGTQRFKQVLDASSRKPSPQSTSAIAKTDKPPKGDIDAADEQKREAIPEQASASGAKNPDSAAPTRSASASKEKKVTGKSEPVTPPPGADAASSLALRSATPAPQLSKIQTQTPEHRPQESSRTEKPPVPVAGPEAAVVTSTAVQASPDLRTLPAAANAAQDTATPISPSKSEQGPTAGAKRGAVVPGESGAAVTSKGDDTETSQSAAPAASEAPEASVFDASAPLDEGHVAAKSNGEAKAISTIEPKPATAVAQQAVDALSPQKAASSPVHAAAPVASTPPASFADANQAQIIGAVHGQLLPNGGSMHIRLDPPELGALQITVKMRDGAMTADFQVSNEQAAKLLSHSLGDLKNQLEAQGVNVERLHVTQGPREPSGQNGTSNGRQGSGADEGAAREQNREQQRREMLRRMWRRLAGGSDPLDMVA